MLYSDIKNLNEEDAIQVVYHLITLLNKGKNEPDDDVIFEQINSALSEEQLKIIDKILVEINYRNIDNDELLDKYILELYNFLEKITVSNRGLNIERGRERLRKLLDNPEDNN